MNKSRAILTSFVLGFLLGGGLVLYGPDYILPYLPDSLKPGVGEVQGTVEAKRLKDDSLLVTVMTPDGATLVTFRKKVAEIDLLVQEGDEITLGLGKYRPFVDDPSVKRVGKPHGGKPQGGKPMGEDPLSGQPPPSGLDTESPEPDQIPRAGTEGTGTPQN